MASREELVERMLRLPPEVQLSFYCHSLWAYDNAPEKARKIVEEYGGDYEKTLEHLRRGIFDTDADVEAFRERLAKLGYGPKRLEGFPE
jgi:hypothetical protein